MANRPEQLFNSRGMSEALSSAWRSIVTIDWQENLRDLGCRNLSAKDRERLLRAINIHGECWLYTGPTNKTGIGMFGVGGRALDARLAAYAMLVGACDPESKPTTSCGHKLCCAPDHLGLESDAVMAAE